MTLIDAAISRSRTTLSALALILVTGFAAYVQIPKEADPDISIPIVYVNLSHEGIGPEDAERLLARPMEIELRSIEGLKQLSSAAYQGGAYLLLEFDAGFDADTALADVREQVDKAKQELPEETDDPSVVEINLSEFPIIVVTVGGTLPERTLLRIARDLEDRFEAIPAVLDAKVGGDRKEVVEIIIDPMLMESYEIDAGHVLGLVARSNTLVAAGQLDTGRGRFAVKVPGLFESLSDIFDMPLKVSGDSAITVRDIATVRRTFKDHITVARVNGKPAFSLEVSKRSGENIIETTNAVRAAVEAERVHWPPGVEVLFSQDRSSDIRTMLKDLENNVTSAILLVMVIVVGALGLRSGFLVGIAIPGSFLAAMLVLSTLGLTVNIVVLFSLILAVGMLVDGAIVVTEYADRKMREGELPRHAYVLAARRMSWPIIASTATTLAAFAPLLFWPGIVGEFMKYLPITLLATLSASLLMALVFVPVLGSNLAPVTRGFLFVGSTLAGGAFAATLALHAWNAWSGGPADMPGNAVAAAAGLFGAWVGWLAGKRLGGWSDRRFQRRPAEGMKESRALRAESDVDPANLRGFTGVYVRGLARVLRRPGSVLAAAGAALVLAWTAYTQFGMGVEFFPEVEPEQAKVLVHARGNLSVTEKAELVGEVEAKILEMQHERGEFSTIYMLAGNLDNKGDDPEDVIGTLSLEFTDWQARRPANEILAELRARTAPLAGILVETRFPRAGPPVGKPVALQLTSRDSGRLAEEAARAAEFFRSLDGLKDIEDGKPIPGIEWEIGVDRTQAAKFGLDVATIGQFVQLVTRGLRISDYRPDDSDEEIDVVIRYPETYRTIDELDRIRFPTAGGAVPIGNFVERRARPRTGTLHRKSAMREITVRADVLPGVLASDKVREIEAWIASEGIDPRVEWTFRGEDEEQQQAQEFLSKAFGIALFVMALILVTQFNRFYSALLILSAVVLSTVGVLLGLLITRQPFGIVMSGIGVIALAGIVVNNNIVLIDTFDRLRRTVSDPLEAILRTGAQRLRPVILTTVTTICGLMPMVLQVNIDLFSREITTGAPSTQWWTQLATAVAFGLAFATLLTLVVTPCALMVRENYRSRAGRRRAVVSRPRRRWRWFRRRALPAGGPSG